MSELNIDVVSAGSNDPILAVGAALPDKIVAMSVPEMAVQVGARLGPANKIRRLRLFGHGSPGLMCVGDVPTNLTLDSTNDGILGQHSDRTLRCIVHETVDARGQTVLTEYFLLNIEPLGRLTNRFAPSGWVELHACHVAEGSMGERLLKMMAAVLRVNVAGATGDQFPGGGLENTMIVARPNGSITRHLPPPAPPRRLTVKPRERVLLPGSI